jgi:hypothetical protein
LKRQLWHEPWHDLGMITQMRASVASQRLASSPACGQVRAH